MAEETSFSANIRGVSSLIESDVNKISGSGSLTPEGAGGQQLDVLDLPMKDDELLALRDEWERLYKVYETKVSKPIAQRNLRSYLGRIKDETIPSEDEIVAANYQFTSEETFLAAATAQDPSPYVYADNSPEGNAVAETVQTMLQFHAQQLLLRRVLQTMVRQWSIHQLAGIKAGWDEKIDDVMLENRKIEDFVFDPDGYVDVYGHFTSWLGERCTVTAERLMELYPGHEKYISAKVEGKLGTKVTYTEWWTDEFCFSTFKEIVLDKHKNEYFNYESEEEEPDELGLMKPKKPRNHFALPKKPYIFFSVFSLQERPHDITGLIEQNIPNQNVITRMSEQIDNNLYQSNNAILFSENNFTQETAKQAANALTKGVGKVLIPPGGPISEAIVRLEANGLPNSIFEAVELHKNDLLSSWGTQGIASQEQKPDTTARGMMLNQSRDTSRIGGGIVDILEQSVAKSCFDWLVQLYHVFYDEKHFGAVAGKSKAVEYVELSARDLDRQLIVGVTPNSMKPRDQISEMNNAIQLFSAKAIGPKTLLEIMDFPDPDEAAGDGVLYAIDPQSYMQLNFPELVQKLQQIQGQMQNIQAQMGQQQIQQGQAEGAQKLKQTEAQGAQKAQHAEESHAQKIRQAEEAHAQKLAIGQLSASQKLNQPKEEKK
jgi:hypothetical protein